MSSVSDDQQSTKKQRNIPGLISNLAIGIVKLWFMLVIAIVFLMGFLLTPWGAKSVVSTANNLFDELTIDYQSGGLGSELHLSSVKWKQSGNNVYIDNLRLSTQLSCVWKLALCIDSVSTDKMVVKLQPIGSPPITESTISAFKLMFPISIEKISLNMFSLEVQDTADISWQKLSGKLDFYQRLRIEKMQLDGFNLTTYTSENPKLTTQAEPFDWAKWRYQSITPHPIVLPVHFDVLAFNMSIASLQLAGQEPIKLKSLSLKATGSKKKLQLHELLVDHDQGQLLAMGNLQLNGYYEHVLSVDADAQLDDGSPLKLTLRSSGNIDSLSAQVDLIETVLSTKSSTVMTQTKPLKLGIDLTAQPSKATLPVEIRLDWTHLEWPLTAASLKSESGVIDINGDLTALNMTIKTMVVGLNMPDTKVSLSAIGVLTAQSKSIELNGFVLDTLGGQVLSQGKLSFSDYINWQGSTTISHLDPGTLWPELAADINGEVVTQVNNSQGVWKAKSDKIDINGQWQGYPLSISGNVDFHQNNGLQLRALLLKNANNILLLNGGVSKQQALDIEFMLDAPDLSNTLPQLGGTLDLVGNVTGSFDQPELSYELLGNDLLVSEVFVQQAEGKGYIKWDEQKQVELNLNLTGIQGISNQVDSAQMILSGDAHDHRFDVTTSGQNSNVNVSIQGQLNQTSWLGNWLSGDIKSSYANLTLLESFKIEANWGKQQYLIAPHCWRYFDNQLCIKQAEFIHNTAAWNVSLKQFDVLSVVRRLVPGMPEIQTNSRLNLDISGEWDITQLPHANLRASLSSGDWVFSEHNNHQLTLDETLVEAQITPKTILAKINLSGNKVGRLSASIQGESGVYADPLNRPIQGELLIERFDLAALKVLVPQLEVLQGGINGQVQIDGTVGNPLLTGELKLSKGALKDESLPVALSAIEQNISLKGQRADFNGSYKLGKGLGEMQGNIVWLPTLKGHLHLSGEALEFDYQNIVKAKVSPNIDLMFESNYLELVGEVTVPYARVKIRELPKGSISPSKDVVLVEKQAEQNTVQQKLVLNVLLKLDPLGRQEVKLDAFGLTTDLQGQLRLQNNKAVIFGSGEVQLVNGRYRAYGQNLVIREGDILFTNALGRPYLNIEAVRDPKLTEDDVIAGLLVVGMAQNPTVTVFSEPVMEQQQILSYMLTGRGLSESSGDSQDTILTNALLSLGLGQSENIISKVGNTLGFEDVSLDTSGQGDSTQLSLTGTVAPGVQLRYGVGVFDSISEVAIRYQLLPKLYIEAVSGASNAIDIYYQFSLDGSQKKQSLDE
jgi:translocation and assembly module TamB